MSAKPSARSERSRSRWASLARLGQVSWFFGNLYEGLVGVPQLLAAAQPQRASGLLGPGSPVRYYVPVAPPTFAATAVTLIDSWRGGGNKRAIITSAAGLASATAISAYLIRTVNLRLLRPDPPLSAVEESRLIGVWHRMNLVRLVALAIAARSLRRATNDRAAQAEH